MIGIVRHIQGIVNNRSAGTMIRCCENCTYFGWEQPEDKSVLHQCAKCKLLYYCSEKCQVEHWYNVHKKHCKYLAKEKLLLGARHDEASCLVCKVEKETGKRKMAKPGNPVLPCTMSSASEKLLELLGTPRLGEFAAAPLAEMSGEFLTKAEATVTIMMRLLLKMKLTRHNVWFMNGNITHQFYAMLSYFRELCWWSVYACVDAPGRRADINVKGTLENQADEIWKISNKIDKLLLKTPQFEERNQFRPWNTMKVLVAFLCRMTREVDRNIAECAGLPKISERLAKIRITSAQFNELWQNVLTELLKGQVSFLTLVKLLSGNDPMQECYGCSRELVEVVEVDVGLGEEAQVKGPVLLFYSSIILSLCGEQKCMKKYDNIIEKDLKLFLIYTKKACMFQNELCDFCAQCSPGVRGHRCSRCLTKFYCGVQCRDKDWAVHKLVCREGEEERKQLGGSKERRKNGLDELKIAMQMFHGEVD